MAELRLSAAAFTIAQAMAHELPVVIRMVDGAEVRGMVERKEIDPGRKMTKGSSARSNLVITIDGSRYALEDMASVELGS